jgi:putative ABC transport system permease protein
MKLKILRYSLFKNKTISIISIAGFAVSISIGLVIVAFISGEYNIDKSYPNLDRMHMVLANENTSSIRDDIREHLLRTYPEITDASQYNNYASTLTWENQPYSGRMIVTDTSFFRIFSIGFTSGDHASLSGPDDIVLTESFANKIFGNADPLGKTLIVEYDAPLIVRGIVKDFPENSSIQGDFFTSSKKRIMFEGWHDGMGTSVYYFRLFVLVANNTDIAQLSEKVSNDIRGIKFTGGHPMEKIRFLPFKETYFTTDIDRSQTSHANLKLIRLLIVVTSIIMILAVFNYINLSTAGYTDRYREIAIKKVTGAGRTQIFTQFMFESFVVCFISFLLAVYLSTFLEPLIEKFLDKKVDLSLLFHPKILLWIPAGVILLSFISGFYPAWSVSGLNPVYILSKNDAMKNRPFGLRAVLNILQNTVSVALIIALIILLKQINFVRTSDYGFETEKLIRVDVHWRLSNKVALIRDKLLSYPSIKDVCFTHGTPGTIYSTSSWDVDGSVIDLNELSTDSSFFSVFQIPILQGREVLSSDFGKVCYINETAFRTTGWETFEGEKYHGREIIGIVKDFHFENLYTKITPMTIQLTSEMGISHMSLRVLNDDLPEIVDILRETWKEVCPGHELKYQFYDEWLNNMYKSEERLASAIKFFALLAIMISALGIIGMAEFTIRKRRKEIGIRKVNGAKISEIMILLNKDFLKWSLLAFVLAVPPTWYIMHSWLGTFAYQTPMNWWIFVLAGLLSLIIGLLTVSWQSLRAATRNPVEALRSE